MTEDNWRHRSVNMRCVTCMYFVPKGTQLTQSGSGEMTGKQIGRCRRNAPTINGFPVAFDSDWCGAHKLDETKNING